MTELLKQLPRPLLEDIVDNQCLPIIGAGFSRNATLSGNKQMPLWDDMGKELAKELGKDYPYSSPIEAVSAYVQEFTRVKLIEKLNKMLYVQEAKPGEAHKEFCSVNFDKVVTTNFDFLLESAYSSIQKSYHPIINEDELSIKPPYKAAILFKFHGDLHHPDRLIATEEDYDSFLDRYPLLATYLSNLLISRTPLFIGYSLNDPDFRQIWQLIGNRLGRLRRPAYSISMELSRYEIKRFERRGVKVVNLKRSSTYSETLAKLFKEIQEYWSKDTYEKSITTTEDSRKELKLTSKNISKLISRLCYFKIPRRLLSFYREHVFPIFQKNGFAPITIDDMISPRANIFAKENALYDRSTIIVVDTDFLLEYTNIASMLQSRYEDKQAIFIQEKGTEVPIDRKGIHCLTRPKNIFENVKGFTEFLDALEKIVKDISTSVEPRFDGEPQRLLDMGEPRAAFISAMTLFESEMRAVIEKSDISDKCKSYYGVKRTFDLLMKLMAFDDEVVSEVKEMIVARNKIIHRNDRITEKRARKFVNRILELIMQIKNRGRINF